MGILIRCSALLMLATVLPALVWPDAHASESYLDPASEMSLEERRSPGTELLLEGSIKEAMEHFMKAVNAVEAILIALTPGASQAAAHPVGSSFRDRLRSGGEGPEMVVIPAGRFSMGCRVERMVCRDYQEPAHEVMIVRPFALSKYEVTFEDYDHLTHLDKVDDEGWGRGRHPVINVSWDEATEYAAWLSAQTGKRYRLPTEAEWEYAARAGSTTMYHYGGYYESQLCRYANHADTSTDYRWRNRGCTDGVGKHTAEVGQYQPNAFGLYDMSGNVWEWVQDCWHENYQGAPSDGSAWLVGGDCNRRVIRGGSWSDFPLSLSSAYRFKSTRSYRLDYLGFRLVQDL